VDADRAHEGAEAKLASWVHGNLVRWGKRSRLGREEKGRRQEPV